MSRRVKNVLIGIGSGYHPAVRMLHAMVRNTSDSSILIFNPSQGVKIIDDNLRERYPSYLSGYTRTFGMLKRWLAKEQFEVAGISIMSHHWELYIQITRAIREALPGCKIIAGGVHAWLIAPERTLDHCDYVCAAEGEQVYARFIERVASEGMEKPLGIPGLIERRGDVLIRTPEVEPLPADDLPFCTIGGGNFFSMTSVDDEPVIEQRDPMVDNSMMLIHASRGCPFRCTFCVNSLAENQKVRIKSVDRVIAEIKDGLAACSSARRVLFCDEIFPLQEEWLVGFSGRYRAEIGLPFQITLFPGRLTRDNILLLKKAGLKEVSMGIQSGSERVRADVYNRFDKNEKLLRENALIAGEKIMTYYDFIIRNPFETSDDHAETVNLVSRLRRPFYLKFYTLAFFPGHPITTRALAEGRITEKDADPMATYLDVTTPHRVAFVDHYHLESQLVVWYKRLLKQMRAGSTEAAYALLLSFYGIWFIPSWILSVLKVCYNRKKTFLVYACGKIVLAILIVRNLAYIKKIYYRYRLLHEKGLREALRRQRPQKWALSI